MWGWVSCENSKRDNHASFSSNGWASREKLSEKVVDYFFLGGLTLPASLRGGFVVWTTWVSLPLGQGGARPAGLHGKRKLGAWAPVLHGRATAILGNSAGLDG